MYSSRLPFVSWIMSMFSPITDFESRIIVSDREDRAGGEHLQRLC